MLGRDGRSGERPGGCPLLGAGGLPGAGYQGGEDFVEGGLSQRLDLVVAAILDGVGHENGSGREPEGGGLRCRGGDEFRGRHEHPGHTATFQIHNVVHTARRATASIG
jgi:hypothetical protein